jgi:hypothetical protein
MRRPLFLTKSCRVHRPILEIFFGGFGEVGSFKYEQIGKDSVK